MWTRVDTGLRDHRKVRKLARELKIEQAHALGLVVNFWLFALNNWDTDSWTMMLKRLLMLACGHMTLMTYCLP